MLTFERGKRVAQQIRAKLVRRVRRPAAAVHAAGDDHGSEQRDGYRLEQLQFANSLDDTVYGICLVPDQPSGAAVLYCHYHGGKYDLGKDELFEEPLFGEWAALTPRGIALVQAGYVVLAVDAYAFGERQHQGRSRRA